MTTRDKCDEYIATLDFKDLQDLSIEKLIAMGWQAAQQCGDGDAVGFIEERMFTRLTSIDSMYTLIHGKKGGEYTLPLYLEPPDQTAKIAELTAKVKELEEYIEIDCRQVIQNFQESDIKLTAKCEKMREALNEIKYHINYQDTDELIVKIIDEVLEGIK